MSNKEIAINILNGMSNEQINAFIALFASDNIKAMIETEQIATDPNRKHYNSFDEIAKEILKDE